MQRRKPHNRKMRAFAQITALSLALLAAPPLTAQETPSSPEEGLGLVERGMRLLFDNFLQEMEPALGDMAEAMKDLEPMVRQLADLIGDVRHYEPPERLENGDIIIRRKADAPPPPRLPVPDKNPQIDVAPDGQVDL